MIEVMLRSDADPLEFEVSVHDETGSTRHQVSMSRRDANRLCGAHAPEMCIEGAFRFLIDREPKEAILARFDVSVISRYFPEFESKLPGYIGQVSKRGG